MAPGSGSLREAWEAVSNHDDANVTLFALAPLALAYSAALVYCLYLLFDPYFADEVYHVPDPNMDPDVAVFLFRLEIAIYLLLLCGFASFMASRVGGPAKLIQILAPPRQVVARRRAPRVYRELLPRRWSCRQPPQIERESSEGTCGPSQAFSGRPAPAHAPALNVLIMITGTHGDVAPFVALAHELRARHGHRIRFATHLAHRDYVLREGLDFYPLAGDPRVLSRWMVQSEGRLLPDIHAPLAKLREEVSEVMPAKVAMINDIMESTWPACVDQLPEELAAGHPRFVAHAIISNPVTYGHIHCASALNIPLHLAFPQPWTPTSEFSHPFVRGTGMPNRITFHAFDQLTQLGLNLNQWRTETLNLPPIQSADRGARALNDLRVPFSYMWSPALVPKPQDWCDSHVDVIGTLVHDAGAAAEYEPDAALAEFLREGPKPVFVGFGSMVVDDPQGLFDLLVEAAECAGARLIVQSSWSKLDGDGGERRRSMHLLGACPHSWLLPRCAAVVHHGGAGTVAAGLRAGLPTFVVPFFGDQHFWGEAVERAGVGPQACAYRDLSVERMAGALESLRGPEMQQRASEMARVMAQEDGVAAMCDSFARRLPVQDMLCYASLFASSEPRVVVAEKWHAGLHMPLSQEAHAVLQASPLRTAYHYDYSYVMWDAHAPAFIGGGLLGVMSIVAQGVLDVLLAIVSPLLEAARCLGDWRERGGRGGAAEVLGATLATFCCACLCVPWLALRRLLQLALKFYLALVEYVLLKANLLHKKRLVHLRARHQCIRPALDVASVPQQRRSDLVRAAVLAEHVLGAAALVQRRPRGKLRRALSPRELSLVLAILARCPAPTARSVPGCCARAWNRLRRTWCYVCIRCSRAKLDEAACLKRWEVDGSGISIVDFCMQYSESARRGEDSAAAAAA